MKLLEMKGMTKQFPGVLALNKVDFSVREGTVHALMGENGAGKSTLMKTLFGIHKANEGQIFFKGEEVKFNNSKQALEAGVAMVHQELNQAIKRDVMDNMWLGRYPKFHGLWVDEHKMFTNTKRIFEALDMEINPRRIMSTMPVSQRQMAEIAKAVSYHSKIIVFDEPTSSLTDVEVKKLFSIINQLRKQGCGIVYISHKMDEIMQIADEISVMRDGCMIATDLVENYTKEKIINQMVGRELTNLYPPKTNIVGEELLRVENLKAKYNIVHDINFSLKKGEILGFAGLDGSGRTETLETLYGVRPKESGDIYIRGKKVRVKSTLDAIKNHMALLTEERRASGIFEQADITFNTTISNLDKYKKHGYLHDDLMRKDTDWAIKNMHIKTPSQTTKIGTLSGGNQQKVILGRWLVTNPDILLLDDPTRGIDVGAKFEIYELIIQLASQGKACIMVSSEMSELLGVCDRIIVVSGGTIAGEVDPKTATQTEIMRLAAKYA